MKYLYIKINNKEGTVTDKKKYLKAAYNEIEC